MVFFGVKIADFKNEPRDGIMDDKLQLIDYIIDSLSKVLNIVHPSPNIATLNICDFWTSLEDEVAIGGVKILLWNGELTTYLCEIFEPPFLIKFTIYEEII